MIYNRCQSRYKLILMINELKKHSFSVNYCFLFDHLDLEYNVKFYINTNHDCKNFVLSSSLQHTF